MEVRSGITKKRLTAVTRRSRLGTSKNEGQHAISSDPPHESEYRELTAEDIQESEQDPKEIRVIQQVLASNLNYYFALLAQKGAKLPHGYDLSNICDQPTLSAPPSIGISILQSSPLVSQAASHFSSSFIPQQTSSHVVSSYQQTQPVASHVSTLPTKSTHDFSYPFLL